MLSTVVGPNFFLAKQVAGIGLRFSSRQVTSRKLWPLPNGVSCNDVQRNSKSFHLRNESRKLSGHLRCFSSTTPTADQHRFTATDAFSPKKALILAKLSRYEFEKRRNPDLSEEKLAKKLADRGSEYKSLLHHHNIHRQCLDLVVKTLESHDIETKVVQRFDYTRQLVDWADVIFTAGGDGTFLLAASRVHDPRKPIIGVNTDPTRSEGYLCLPKMYANNFPQAMVKLLDGKFKWRWRQRIRITMIGANVDEAPIELHDQQLQYPEYRFMDCLQESHPAAPEVTLRNGQKKKMTKTLPVPALNEVFIGESLSSRVSYYEVSFDGSKWEKQKSSGITVCTGTGSSSWSFNINKLTQHCVKHLLRIVKEETKMPIDETCPNLVSNIVSRFNNSLLFDPSVKKMAYTVRDPVVNGLVNVHKPRGFARRIEIKSRCFDACLVVDGGLSFAFNDGARAILELLDEDALKTVVIDE